MGWIVSAQEIGHEGLNWVWGMIGGCLMADAAPAQAQMAVIDVAAIEQLLVQINYWKQQIDGDAERARPVEADARGADRAARHAVAAAD